MGRHWWPRKWRILLEVEEETEAWAEDTVAEAEDSGRGRMQCAGGDRGNYMDRSGGGEL